MLPRRMTDPADRCARRSWRSYRTEMCLPTSFLRHLLPKCLRHRLRLAASRFPAQSHPFVEAVFVRAHENSSSHSAVCRKCHSSPMVPQTRCHHVKLWHGAYASTWPTSPLVTRYVKVFLQRLERGERVCYKCLNTNTRRGKEALMSDQSPQTGAPTMHASLNRPV